MLVLDGLKNGALSVGGGSTLHVSGGDVVVNSASRAAAKTSGESSVLVDSPGLTRVAGLSTGGGFHPAAVHGSDAVADWLANVAMPTVSGLPARQDGAATLQPGVYADEIEIKGGSVTLLPGVYVLRGGLTVKEGATLSGSGVTIFNTADDECEPLEFKGAARISLSAPSDGPYRGLLIYQDPACDEKLKWADGSSADALGTIYAPNAEFAVESGARLVLTQLIADRLTVSGTASRLSIAYDRALAAQP